MFDTELVYMKLATYSDMDTYFKWVNDSEVRKNSFNNEIIGYNAHVDWFNRKINSKDSNLYIFYYENIPIGQVRIDCISFTENIIDISVDVGYRGKGLGVLFLKMASNDFKLNFHNKQLIAYVKKDNLASIKQFIRANFNEVETFDFKGVECVKLIK